MGLSVRIHRITGLSHMRSPGELSVPRTITGEGHSVLNTFLKEICQIPSSGAGLSCVRFTQRRAYFGTIHTSDTYNTATVAASALNEL